MSETVLILAVIVVVLALIFGVRISLRALSGAPAPAGATDVAGVVALPPVIFLGFLAAAAVLEALIPVPSAAAYPTARYMVAAVLFVIAGVVVVSAAGRFRAAGTNIPPTLPTTALVIDGVYALTRNPMYLASTLVYAGIAVAAGSLWAVALMIPLLWVINVGVIAREERYLERKFGDAYRAYKGRVRRWM